MSLLNRRFIIEFTANLLKSSEKFTMMITPSNSPDPPSPFRYLTFSSNILETLTSYKVTPEYESQFSKNFQLLLNRHKKYLSPKLSTEKLNISNLLDKKKWLF